MSGFVEWMGAQGEEPEPEVGVSTGYRRIAQENEREPSIENVGDGTVLEKLPAHNFPAEFGEAKAWQQEENALDRNPDLWLYRERTVGLLRRYMRFSIETGRLPSLLGREFFRAKVTYYKAGTFEDRVIFVRDVETCLNRLAYLDQQLIARVILQEYSQEHAARILHCCRKTVQRRVPEMLDLVSEDFLRVGLLAAIPARRTETL
ncbi:MAG: hypothetical protein JWQ87_3324 [Candidatus Sulfotelmatobacter sp.]|nr:hypothetical protein [Candidatus Sulfotelmatobacter sp.]